MKRGLVRGTIVAAMASGALFFSSCSTVSTRIDSQRAAFDRLPPAHRALVSEGKISGGMSQEAVYIAWGEPEQKATGEVRGVPTETWVYLASTASYSPYGPGWYGGWGYSGRVAFVGRHGGRRVFASFYDPLWDPFYYPFPATIQYPVKTVSFQRGRVIAFQYLRPGA